MDAESPTVAFGRQLEKSRRRRGWSQEELAERAGMSRLQINRIERNARGRRVDLDEALLLAYLLDVAPVHLVVPREDTAFVRLAADVEIEAVSVRSWFRGEVLIREVDDGTEWGEALDFFQAEVAAEELRVLRSPLRTLHDRARNVLELVEDLARKRDVPKKPDLKYVDEAIVLLEEELERVMRMKPAPKRRKEARSGSR